MKNACIGLVVHLRVSWLLNWMIQLLYLWFQMIVHLIYWPLVPVNKYYQVGILSIVQISFEFLIICAAQGCLSPNVLKVRDRPKPQNFSITNTSVILKWMPPPLEEYCDDIVISYPPIIFGINVKCGIRPISGFPIVSSSDILNFNSCIYFRTIIIIVHIWNGIRSWWFTTFHHIWGKIEHFKYVHTKRKLPR